MATYKPKPKRQFPELFKLPVRDDAMAPMVSRGDVILVSPRKKPHSGHCVVMGTEFGGELRQLELLDDGRIVGQALNTEYEDIDSAEERVWLIAVVVGIERATND